MNLWRAIGVTALGCLLLLSGCSDSAVVEQAEESDYPTFSPLPSPEEDEDVPTLNLVPNVVGDRINVARRKLKRFGFDVRLRRERSTRPEGTILKQMPRGGLGGIDGQLVTLLVSRGPRNVAPPPPLCDYDPCLPPASDYDCAGGTGDGPEYTSTVRVIGIDIYDLDDDDDGIGCE
ncbi:MAG: PASTA domain-containing protein [Actinomycetota bacterium]